MIAAKPEGRKERHSGWRSGLGVGPGFGGGVGGGVYRAAAPSALAGQIRGQVADAAGGVLPGVTIVLEAGRSRLVATTAPMDRSCCSAVPRVR